MPFRPLLLALLATGSASAATSAENYRTEIVPILENYCFSCHGEGVAKGKFSMDEFKDLSAHLSDREHWLHIWRNLRSRSCRPSTRTS